MDDCGIGGSRKRGRGCDQERKKGVPWTEEEHRRFMMGLKKYGKGEWRNIWRNYVISKTPTQVASHAQKYFLWQLSGSKDKRKSLNLAETDNKPSETKKCILDEKSVDTVLVPDGGLGQLWWLLCFGHFFHGVSIAKSPDYRIKMLI